MSKKDYVIGIDYGTDSVRALIVDTQDGDEIEVSVCPYQRWSNGDYCDPGANQFRQHPLDYIESLEEVITSALSKVSLEVKNNIRGIAVDTTGSTPCAVDRNGVPLAMKKEFSENPNAMFILWKDHTGVKEADEITGLSKTWGGMDFTKYVGGIYSSEWFWAKILHTLRKDTSIRDHAYSWIEHCDWIPALLSGIDDVSKIKRSRCAAGHKAMWHEEFSGLPSEEFLVKLDPLLAGLKDRLYQNTYTSNESMGRLSSEWAMRLGLNQEVVVGVGAFDAHMGAVGGGIKPYVLSKVMGTSTCDMLIAPSSEIGDKLIRGICGQVHGSIIPGMMGMEAGQSAFGDIYAWFKNLLLWPVRNLIAHGEQKINLKEKEIIKNFENRIIPELSKRAGRLPVDEKGILVLDWMNGRRTPDANQLLKGAITGLNLGSDAPQIFKALVEGTAFGAKMIVERFRTEGIVIKEVIALGGVAKKAPYIMQVVSDVLDKKIKIVKSGEACALGAAMFAATAAGIYPAVEQAQSRMESGFEKEYVPNKENAQKYQTLFRKYSVFGEFIEKQIQKEKSGG